MHASFVRILQDHSKTLDLKSISNCASLPNGYRIHATYSLALSSSLLAYASIIGEKGLELWLVDIDVRAPLCATYRSQECLAPDSTPPSPTDTQHRRSKTSTASPISPPAAKSDPSNEIADSILASNIETCSMLSSRLAKVKVAKYELPTVTI